MSLGLKRTMTVLTAFAAAAALSLPVSAMAAGPGGGGGGGKPGGETVGNNLSFPVEWSEACRLLTLRGTEEQATVLGVVLPGTYTMDDTTPCLGAVQKDALNTWQAENELVPGTTVARIDWGDNLESKDWRVGQVVRVETGLYDDVTTPMTRYQMCYISGSGTSEVWGLQVTDNGAEATPRSSPVSSESTEAMVYTAGARMTIQLIDPAMDLKWDAEMHQWVPVNEGDVVADPVFNKATHEKIADGPGSYGAELNVQGKVIYGYVWNTRGLTAGEYRLTFSLDQLPTFESGTSFDEATKILVSVETEVVAEDEEGGNVALVDVTNPLTYIDVALTAGGGGGRK